MHNHLRVLASVLIFLGFIYLVERYVGWRRLLTPWAEIPLPQVAAAVALAFASYWLRALRLHDYFRTEMAGRMSACMKLTLQHNLYNNLLPMRTGELSFPLLMARYFGVQLVRSIPALLWFRLLDFHILMLLGLLAAGGHWWPWELSFVLFLLWAPMPYLIFHYSGRLRARLGNSSGWRRKFAEALAALPLNHNAFWRAWGWTAINWVVKIAAFAWVLGLFIDVPAGAAWMGAMFGDMTSVLPIHGVAGAGTYEAGVVAGLLPYGVEARAALAAAVNLHLFLLGSTLIGGAVGVWMKVEHVHG